MKNSRLKPGDFIVYAELTEQDDEDGNFGFNLWLDVLDRQGHNYEENIWSDSCPSVPLAAAQSIYIEDIGEAEDGELIIYLEDNLIIEWQI